MRENLLSAIVLGVVQGVSEFAPVSSSGHLVAVPWLFGWPAPSVAFDVMLHLGTLVAVIAYFRRDLWAIVLGVFGAGDPTRIGMMRRLAVFLVVATVPGAVIGKLFSEGFEGMFGRPLYVGVFFFATAAILVSSEWAAKVRARGPQGTASETVAPKRKPGGGGRHAATGRDVDAVRPWDAIAMGFAQALAILPGISRSGATIGAGMWMGLARDEAARFSFLMSIPIILGAAVFKLDDMVVAVRGAGDALVAGAGFGAAGVSGFLCIHLLLPYLRSRPLHVFAAYCVSAGTLTMVVSLAGSIR